MQLPDLGNVGLAVEISLLYPIRFGAAILELSHPAWSDSNRTNSIQLLDIKFASMVGITGSYAPRLH